MPSPRPIFPLLGALGTIGILLAIREGEGNLRLLLGQAGNDGQGFCCVRDGQPCLQMGIEECDQANGLGFTGDQPSCSRLCGTPTSSARASSTPISSRPPQSSLQNSAGQMSSPPSSTNIKKSSSQGTSTGQGSSEMGAVSVPIPKVTCICGIVGRQRSPLCTIELQPTMEAKNIKITATTTKQRASLEPSIGNNGRGGGNNGFIMDEIWPHFSVITPRGAVASITGNGNCPLGSYGIGAGVCNGAASCIWSKRTSSDDCSPVTWNFDTTTLAKGDRAVSGSLGIIPVSLDAQEVLTVSVDANDSKRTVAINLPTRRSCTNASSSTTTSSRRGRTSSTSVSSTETSSTTLSLSICGNGERESDEDCDDGNQVDTDTCTNVCTVGNEEGEDFGITGTTGGDGWYGTGGTKPPTCGNGRDDPEEECDDSGLPAPPPSLCSEVTVPANTDQGLRYDHRKPTGPYRIEVTSPTGLSDNAYANYTWANWPTDDRARHHGSSLFLLQNRNIEWSPDTDPVTSPLGGERVSNSNFSFDSLLLNPPYNQSRLRVADAARGIGTTVHLNDGDFLLFIVNAIRGIGTQQGAFSENRGNVHISICPASPTPASLSLTSSFSSSSTSPPSSTEQSSGAQSSLHLLSSTANGGTNSTGTSYQFISPNGTPYKLLPTITPEGVPGYIFQTPGVRGGTSLLTPVTLPNGTPGYLWTSPNGTSTYFASSPSPVPGTYQFQNPTGEVSYLSPAGSPPPPSSYQFIAPDGTALTLLPTITPEGTPGYVFQTTGAGGGTSLLISMMLPDGNIGSVLRAPDGSLTSFLRSSTVSQESFTFRSPTGSSVPLRPLALPSSLHASAPEEGSCGDGIVQTPDEQCEPSLHNPALPFACKNCRFFSQFCGDGKTDPGEECDDGLGNADQPNIRCRNDCGYARCGDGILDSLLEQCDFQAPASPPGCNRSCSLALPATPLSPLAFLPPPDQISGFRYQILEGFPVAEGQPNLQPTTYNLPPRLPRQPATGPEILAIMAAGAAGGFAWMRRRRS